MQPTADELDAITRALGELLRRCREERGWTRDDLRRAMFPHVVDHEGQEDDDKGVPHRATIATWELGTRSITMIRFVQVCAALKVNPGDVVNQALDRVRPAAQLGVILIDGQKLARSTNPRLQRLKEWAASRNGRQFGALTSTAADVIEVPPAALGPLAALAKCNSSQLIDALRDLDPDRS